MDVESSNGVNFYFFQNLSSFPELYHGITTRQGGGSRPPFDSLNMAQQVGDSADQVAVNRQRVWSRFDGAKPIFLNQVHSSTVAVWNGASRMVDGRLPGEADAAVTNQRDWLLTILVADCQPVMLYDPTRAVIANIHSGWRGSIANIIGRTVAVMEAQFGCDVTDIRAGIGPSLGPCCAEFVNYRKEIPESLWAYRVSDHHFDFWAMSRDQLVQAGLRPDHVETGNICTCCRQDLFYSYRGAHQTGRIAAVIGMKPGGIAESSRGERS